MGPVETICELFATRGGALYFGEAVTEEQHALQAAALADGERAPDALVVSALLHDIGHLLHGLDEHIAETGHDARHEDIGFAWLTKHFDRAISNPVRLHVAAKRYLCAEEPAYKAGLSAASAKSLALQGGPMSPDECESFEREPHFEAAVRVRRWDDAAKVVGLAVPPLEHYRVRLNGCLRPT